MASRIKRNAIICNHCGDEIESKHVHDFKWCSCKKVAVDGGTDYLRRLYPGGAPSEHFKDISIEDPLEVTIEPRIIGSN